MVTRADIPTDSLLRHWCDYLSLTEIPFSYQVAAGLTVLGCAVRRYRYVDQVEWRVYPNQSVLFIGPSGIGKDTIINRAQKMIESVDKSLVIAGKTMEAVHTRLQMLNSSSGACAYVPAGELTAFFGKADYQANMLTGFTDLLSTGEKIDITTKGNLIKQDGSEGKPKYIFKPTVTMHGGSTVEWLHRSMPDGTLEGGFLGRFLIVCEEFSGRHVPLLKYTDEGELRPEAELDEARAKLQTWEDGVKEILKGCTKAEEMTLSKGAARRYASWYKNRFSLFSKTVLPYANRSRDMVLRLAMLMALSRQHHTLIEEVDIKFAIDLIAVVATKIDGVVLPPTDEAKVAAAILELIPTHVSQIYSLLGIKHRPIVIKSAIELLTFSNKMKSVGGLFVPVEADGKN